MIVAVGVVVARVTARARSEETRNQTKTTKEAKGEVNNNTQQQMIRKR